MVEIFGWCRVVGNLSQHLRKGVNEFKQEPELLMYTMERPETNKVESEVSFVELSWNWSLQVGYLDVKQVLDH